MILNAEQKAKEFEDAIYRHVRYTLGQEWQALSKNELFRAVSLAVRDQLIDGMLATENRYDHQQAKRLYYLSMEFLIGRSLENNLYNLGILELCQNTLARMGVDLDELIERERDAALGNGGLGRLAACFLDSLATLDMPGYGYGINYEYGIFRQEINNGNQEEKPDTWLAHGYPWEIERPEEACLIPVYGRVVPTQDRHGFFNPMWMDWKLIIGVPYDMPIVGFGGQTVNYLRLYSARSSEEFDMTIFNQGDFLKAVEQKTTLENISKVLYPSDTIEEGRELRLLQEYFLVACALKDIIKQYLQENDSFQSFPKQVAIQMNDTHPALAVVELMRILVDENELSWEYAWELTQATLGYTNHTLMPEALEKWPAYLLAKVLPRHLQLIYEINRRFLEYASSVWPGEKDRIKRLTIIEEDAQKQVRMAHLAIVGSHSVNGVSELHTELIKSSLVPDFYQLWPEKFNNKTNGVTQRRWLLKANPRLSQLITQKIGDGWITDLSQLHHLEPYAEDLHFQAQFMEIKRANKQLLAQVIKDTTQVVVDPDSLFDVQIKRIHEYKRQLLAVMQIIHEYLNLIEDGQVPLVPRTYIFAGKAAPGYWAAKQIIRLINAVGNVINQDPRVEDRFKVIFIPDYRVSLAEKIIPAADLSEQISTAGKEASGTGNMKFAMNGALTIGTLDGANIEIMEEVGEENIFIFGLQADEIQEMKDTYSYHSREYYEREPLIKRVVDTFNSNLFCPDEPDLFQWIYQTLLDYGDEYFQLADLKSYIATQEQVGQEYLNPSLWAQKAILNVARIGKFSSDRTITEYAHDIWGIQSIR